MKEIKNDNPSELKREEKYLDCLFKIFPSNKKD